jgi:ATP-dependent protease ClpP protease subunit
MERLSDLVRIRKDKEYPIYIVLDSPGGSVISGLNFINFVNQFENIHTICLFCASMATTIQQLVTGKRYANNINIMMFHRAKVGIQGQIEDGELEQRLKLYKRLVREVERDVASRLRMSHKRFKKKIKDEYWTYGKQSKREGIVDEIVDLKCSKTLLNTRNCPLYR